MTWSTDTKPGFTGSVFFWLMMFIIWQLIVCAADLLTSRIWWSGAAGNAAIR